MGDCVGDFMWLFKTR